MKRVNKRCICEPTCEKRTPNSKEPDKIQCRVDRGLREEGDECPHFSPTVLVFDWANKNKLTSV